MSISKKPRLNSFYKRFYDFKPAIGIAMLLAGFIMGGVMVEAQEPVSRILIKKAERILSLLDKDGNTLKSYPVSLGFEPAGHKIMEGDGRTPEGVYKISGRNPKSSYYLSLRISYPNDKDRSNAKKRGYPPGGDIMIHGLPNGMGLLKDRFKGQDWTLGCIAINDNEAMDEVYKTVKDGTVVEILP